MMAIASQITSLTIVYSAVYSGAHQRKHQSSASLAFVWRIQRGPVNSPHKWPVTRKMFPFDDVIMFTDAYMRTLAMVGWFTGTHKGQASNRFCSKTCLATVFIRSILAREKLHERFSASAVFPAQNRTNEHSSKACFALITHLLSIQTTKSWKMLMNNKFKAHSLNRKAYLKFTLSWFSVTCFQHVGLLWPISALDRKQVSG